MTKTIDNAVNKFLWWKLPADFSPDCYIQFKHPGGYASWPIGANLMTYTQAKAMFTNCLSESIAAEEAKPPLDAEREALRIELMAGAKHLSRYDLPGLPMNPFAAACLKAADMLAAYAQEIDDLKDSKDFYKRRVELLQQWQPKMRDPERTIACDIIANGQTLPPENAGDRYKISTDAQQVAVPQEPAIVIDVQGGRAWLHAETFQELGDGVHSLYAAPQADAPTQPMTDDDLEKMWITSGADVLYKGFRVAVKMTEGFHKIGAKP